MAHGGFPSGDPPFRLSKYRTLDAAFGNLLYSLRSPSPAVLALRVTIRSARRRTDAPPLARILGASAPPPQGCPSALRGLDPTERMLGFGCHQGLVRGLCVGIGPFKIAWFSEGGKTSQYVNFYLLPRSYAPRLSCSDDPKSQSKHFIFRYDKWKTTTPKVRHLSA
jgi:hypothetical protein